MGIVRKLMPVVALIGGVGVGGGSAMATLHFAGPPGPARAEPATPTGFVPVPKILAPLVLPDGGLAGYVSFDVALEVPEAEVAAVTLKLPLLFNAINMRTYRTPLATGPAGQLPDIARLRAVVMEATPEAFGPGIVKRVAVTRAEPN